MTKLVAAIAAAGGPPTTGAQIDPRTTRTAASRAATSVRCFLFRTDRGLAFVDRPGGGATTADRGDWHRARRPHLTFSPGRIDPTNAAFNSSRKPLAGEFIFNGHHLFVIANHFNSKGGDDPLLGRFQPPARSSEAQRHQQAQIVHDFVAQILAADPGAERRGRRRPERLRVLRHGLDPQGTAS